MSMRNSQQIAKPRARADQGRALKDVRLCRKRARAAVRRYDGILKNEIVKPVPSFTAALAYCLLLDEVRRIIS